MRACLQRATPSNAVNNNKKIKKRGKKAFDKTIMMITVVTVTVVVVVIIIIIIIVIITQGQGLTLVRGRYKKCTDSPTLKMEAVNASEISMTATKPHNVTSCKTATLIRRHDNLKTH
jgi:hypothetical protein